jgi:hypothetical protein
METNENCLTKGLRQMTVNKLDIPGTICMSIYPKPKLQMTWKSMSVDYYLIMVSFLVALKVPAVRL